MPLRTAVIETCMYVVYRSSEIKVE